MVGITEAEVDATIGPIDRIVMDEIVRTGASRLELRRALAMARGRADLEAASALPARMQRLVDLLAVTLPEQGPALPRDRAEKNIGRAA
ncbi:hypothetical protein [Bosea sp. BH3]|uniref:hypothetical protein n=1 Tax=Bosea sp. BH3 TaxID=2871701 RepID=UPI0021CB7925|nr:hypothetical protein [Bosea sp. BH3]MCU4181597.1 hypothetical protein [Bosea sp. BH3]